MDNWVKTGVQVKAIDGVNTNNRVSADNRANANYSVNADNRTVPNNRRDYLDVFKFIGIFSIYLGHMADAAGDFYPFVFMYHVPLFFFASGCTETLGRERSIPGYILHKVKTILVPWLFFALLSVAVYIACAGAAFPLSDVGRSCVQILQGCVRNRFLAGSLWFFTCQFVICVAFRLIEKWNRILIFVICLLVCILSQTVLPQTLPGEPSWFWNVDSAMYYLLYYCAGYLLFPYIERFFSNFTGERRMFPAIVSAVIWIVCFIYTLLCYYSAGCLQTVWGLPHIGTAVYYAQALVIILFLLGAAFLLRNVKVFQRLGKDTLFLCGNEMIIKLLVPAFAGIFGLEATAGSQLETLVYVGLMLLITDRLLVPAERQLLSMEETQGKV